jgi:hypothetical protein
MPKTLKYNSARGCPSGYHHRRAYKTRKGTYVKPRCVKSTTVYPESQAQFQSSRTARARRKLKNVGKRLGLTKKCAPGYILRAPYKRKFSSTIKREGYSAKRSGKTIRAYPKSGSVLVKASCIKDRGLPGKGPKSGKGIGSLRKGELSKYGYKAKESRDKRHAALKKAVAAFGALGVFRKLDAITKYTVRTAPEAHTVFKADRDWVRGHYSLKAF